MPGDPRACRENAERCLKIAAEAHTVEAKERFENLARLWWTLATDLEQAQSLLEAWGEPESRAEPSRHHPHPSWLKHAS